MEPIQFENLYDFLALEMDKTPESVRATAMDHTFAEERFIRPAKDTFANRSARYVLTSPLVNPTDGQMLFAAGVDLRDKMGTLLGRQIKTPSIPLGPIAIEASDDLVSVYKRKVDERWQAVFKAVATLEDPMLKRLMGALDPKAIEYMGMVITDTMNKASSTTAGLMSILNATKDAASINLWKSSYKTAYVVMSIADTAHELASIDERRKNMEICGRAAVLSDISVLLKPMLYKNEVMRHPQRSAQIAKEMGFADNVALLIEHHHSYQADDEPQESEEKAKKPEANHENVKFLIVASLFVAALEEAESGGKDIEAIKGLNFLMTKGKLDKLAVTTLTRLYLSRKFALFVEKATEIALQCPYGKGADPVLWNILGERNPQKFICKMKDCPNLGTQLTMVSNNIPVVFDGKVVAKIKKGEYFTCGILTDELLRLYKKIASLAVK